MTGTTPVLEATMVPFADLLAALKKVRDPRRRQGQRYPLAHLLLFSVLAILAGATSYRGILVFIAVHRERLNAVFGTRLRRAPAVNTLRAGFGSAVRAHWGIENRAHHVRDRILREDDSRIPRKPGIFARLRSFALNILRANSVANVSEAIYTNALSLNRLLACGRPKAQN